VYLDDAANNDAVGEDIVGWALAAAGSLGALCEPAMPDRERLSLPLCVPK